MAPAIPLTKSRRRIASPQCSEQGIIVAGQTGKLEVVKTALSNVRFGSKADIRAVHRHVRFTPKADIRERNWDVRFVPKADSCSATN